MTDVKPQDQHVSSTGQTATRADWLDAHFEACRPEYERAVVLAGFQPGWHVLDAGCGSGSFIPLLAAHVGPHGWITAVDLASENVDVTRERVAGWGLSGHVRVVVGSLPNLPFPDDAFDAVWLGNVLMYFTDAELLPVLHELTRVVRPGGVVVAKESDGPLLAIGPLPMELLRELSMLGPLPPRIPGVNRARQHLHWFRRARLEDVVQETILEERAAPLSDIDRAYAGPMLAGMSRARLAQDSSLSDAARAFLERQLDPLSADAAINQPDFTLRAGHVVTAGRVPGVSG